ncbi:MAG: PLP-dependent transferase, partial [Candidatus Ancillula sp.]|nr:PLP-dependent transferase [Candidatus Ancillula sp.]
MKTKKFETICVRGGYSPKTGEPVVPPIVASTTYRYETTEQVHELFDLSAQGYFYSRIENPTNTVVEKRVASLEGGVGAVLTSSGQAATFFAIINIAGAGDHIVAARSIYGGSVNLIQHRLSRLGISCTFIDNDSTQAQIEAAVEPNTKLIFGEVLSNPTLKVLDIATWANAAHNKNIPLIIDNTFPTPYFCRPFEFGADIVTHSATKYLDGHALQVSGIIVDSGNFNWAKAYEETGKFAEVVLPDSTYKNISYTQKFGNMAYIVKARVQLMRDIGATCSPFGAFLLQNGIQTLALRMKQHYINAFRVANFLELHDKVENVNFPALKNNKYYNVACKYLPDGCSGVLSFEVKGGRDAAGRVINALKLV